MKKFVFSIVSTLTVIFFGNQVEAQSASKEDITMYFKENVAIVDARVRSVDKEHYVRELIMIDFKKAIALPEAFEFFDSPFIDNGKGFDKIAGDGVYTSSNNYLHNEKVPYLNSATERSVTGQALADIAFSHKNELQNYLSSIASKFVVSLDCDIYTCHCNSCPCKTCWMPIIGPGGGVIGTVTYCLKIKNCHFTIGWE